MTGYIGQGKVQFLDNNGRPLSGGQVWVYLANSTTPANTYNDFNNAINGVSPQTNPVPLNSRGEAIIIINNAVKLVVEDSNINPSTGHGNEIWSLDYFSVADAAPDVSGGYHISGNTIVDSFESTAFGFNSAPLATAYVELNSNVSASPSIKAVDGTVTDRGLTIQAQNAGAITLNSATNIVGTTAITGATTVTGTTSLVGNTTVTGTVTTSGAVITPALTLPDTDGTSTFKMTLQAPSVLPADKTYTLPTVDGTANSHLRTDGAGALSFTTPSTNQLCWVTGINVITTLAITPTFTTLNFDTAVLDPNSIFNLTTDTLTPKQAGYYMITARATTFVVSGGVSWGIFLFKNTVRVDDVNDVDTTFPGQSIKSWIVAANGTTDSFQIRGWQSSAGTQDVKSPVMTCYLISGL